MPKNQSILDRVVCPSHHPIFNDMMVGFLHSAVVFFFVLLLLLATTAALLLLL